MCCVKIVLNIFKSENRFKGSITDKQFKCLLDNGYLDRTAGLGVRKDYYCNYKIYYVIEEDSLAHGDACKPADFSIKHMKNIDLQIWKMRWS